LLVVVRLPVVTVDAESENVSVDVNNTVPLKIHSLPIATTFAIFDEYVLQVIGCFLLAVTWLYAE